MRVTCYVCEAFSIEKPDIRFATDYQEKANHVISFGKQDPGNIKPIS